MSNVRDALARLAGATAIQPAPTAVQPAADQASVESAPDTALPAQASEAAPLPVFGNCGNCQYWFDAEKTFPGQGRGSSSECRRHLQLDQTRTMPYQPRTRGADGCFEHAALPAPPDLAGSCSDCRFWLVQIWQPIPGQHTNVQPGDVGRCRRFVPVPDTIHGSTFCKTRRDFRCGAGRTRIEGDPPSAIVTAPPESPPMLRR